MLRVLHGVKIPFEFKSFDTLALGLEKRNEPMLLEVMTELNMISDPLVDWFFRQLSRLVKKGEWPMRNALCICNILPASGICERAS